MANTERRSRTKRGIFIALVLVLLVYIIGSTYARYTNTSTLNGKVQMAEWQVKINTEDMNATATTQDVTLTLEDNEFVSDDRIAPDRTGYFDITLDPTGSEVAIDYIISCDFDNVATGIADSGSDIAISGAEYWRAATAGTAGSGTAVDVNSATGVKISETLAEVEGNTPITVRVKVTWTHHTDGSLDSNDTANGVAARTAANAVITIPVTVTAQQHISGDTVGSSANP